MLFSQAWRARADAEIKALRNDQVGESYELGGGGVNPWNLVGKIIMGSKQKTKNTLYKTTFPLQNTEKS